MDSAAERLAWVFAYFNSNPNGVISKYNEINPTGKSITKQAIYNIEKGKTKKISLEVADVFKTVFPEISKEWLTTGKGDKLVPRKQYPEITFETIASEVNLEYNKTDSLLNHDKLMEQIEALKKEINYLKTINNKSEKMIELLENQLENLQNEKKQININH